MANGEKYFIAIKKSDYFEKGYLFKAEKGEYTMYGASSSDNSNRSNINYACVRELTIQEFRILRVLQAKNRIKLFNCSEYDFLKSLNEGDSVNVKLSNNKIQKATFVKWVDDKCEVGIGNMIQKIEFSKIMKPSPMSRTSSSNSMISRSALITPCLPTTSTETNKRSHDSGQLYDSRTAVNQSPLPNIHNSSNISSSSYSIRKQRVSVATHPNHPNVGRRILIPGIQKEAVIELALNANAELYYAFYTIFEPPKYTNQTIATEAHKFLNPPKKGYQIWVLPHTDIQFVDETDECKIEPYLHHPNEGKTFHFLDKSQDKSVIELALYVDGDVYYAFYMATEQRKTSLIEKVLYEALKYMLPPVKGEFIWILPHSEIQLVEDSFFLEGSLPEVQTPVGFGLEREMIGKVNNKDYFGVVKTTGKINGNWYIGMLMKGKINCPIVKKYPQLAELFPSSKKSSLVFVDPGLVRMVLEQDNPKRKQAPAVPMKWSVPYTKSFFESLKPGEDPESWLSHCVEVHISAEPHYGVCRWMGYLEESKRLFVGIEMDQPVPQHEMFFFPKLGLFPCKTGHEIVVPRNLISLPDFPIQSYGYNTLNKSSIKIFCEVPHTKKFMSQLTFSKKLPEDFGFGIDFAVEVDLSVPQNDVDPIFGKCMYVGQHRKNALFYIGVMLENRFFSEAVTNGTFPYSNGVCLFQCDPQKGVLLPRYRVRRDRRHVAAEQLSLQMVEKLDAKHKQKCNPTEEPSQFVMSSEYIAKFQGDNGIQGKDNSCYMDTSLMAMFAFNCTFDDNFQSNESLPLIQTLRNYVINPLRSYAYVPHENVMKFRKDFEAYTSSVGMTINQKDPEEFLNILFEKVFQVSPFLTYDDGDKSYFLQVFHCPEKMQKYFSVREMVQRTFTDFNSKLTASPSNLIVFLPREGRQFINFELAYLDLQLNPETLIRSDYFNPCFRCQRCSNYYCRVCMRIICSECSSNQACCSISNLQCIHSLELYAVLCIDISHYVAFIRTKPYNSQRFQWFFYDSMAEREGEINIPNFHEVPHLEEWLRKTPSEIFGKNSFPSDYHKRLVKNAYVLFYRNSRVTIYS